MGNVPKAEWGPGLWQGEPDTADWRDAVTGLQCRIRRNLHCTGALCGYVGVAPGHPFFGMCYTDKLPVREEFLRDGPVGIIDVFCYALGGDHEAGLMPLGMVLKVHGGITWSGAMPDGSDETLHWFGFDCGHSGDLSPQMNALMKSYGSTFVHRGEVYRDWNYVKGQCEALALQLNYWLLHKDQVQSTALDAVLGRAK